MDELNKGALRLRVLQRRPGRIRGAAQAAPNSAGSTRTSGSTTSSSSSPRRSAARRRPTCGNIYKYYVAYKLMIAADEVQKKARETIKK